MVKKIIIFGFAHSGTTILKSILGHIPEVMEIHNEQKLIKSHQIATDKKYIVCKWPELLPIFFEEQYQDYIKIFIIRNPLWVFSSLNRRNNPKMSAKFNIRKYIQTLQYFIKYHSQQNQQNIFTIKYEELFNDNFKNLKNILDSIGLQYDDSIFNNNLFTNICNQKGSQIPQKEPDEKKHGQFRKWQINQPIVNMNKPEKIDLTEQQQLQILSNQTILETYPEIINYLQKTSKK